MVVNSRLDTCSRQVYMHEEFKEDVDIYKIRNHFICNLFFSLLFVIFHLLNTSYLVHQCSLDRIDRRADCRRADERSDQSSHEEDRYLARGDRHEKELSERVEKK